MAKTPSRRGEWHVGAVADFAEGDRRLFEDGGLTIGVFRLRGRFHAFENRCAHQGGPVCQGRLLSRVDEVMGEHRTSLGMTFSPDHLHLICPWHGWEYDVETGAHPGCAELRLRRFEVVERRGELYVIV